MIMSQSVEHKDCPIYPEFTRSNLFVSGYMIKPIDANTSSVVYMQISIFSIHFSHVLKIANLLGIPKYFREKMVVLRAMIIAKLRKFVEKGTKI